MYDGDLRAAAVYDDGIHADELHEHDVARDVFAQSGSVMAAPPYLMTMVFP